MSRQLCMTNFSRNSNAMALYQIEWKRSAQKELRKLPATTIRKILDAVQQLAEQPFPPGVKKLVGTEQTYRCSRWRLSDCV